MQNIVVGIGAAILLNRATTLPPMTIMSVACGITLVCAVYRILSSEVI